MRSHFATKVELIVWDDADVQCKLNQSSLMQFILSEISAFLQHELQEHPGCYFLSFLITSKTVSQTSTFLFFILPPSV